MAEKGKKGRGKPSYLTRFQEAKDRKQREEQSTQDSLAPDDRILEEEITAEALFRGVLKDASPADILSEYYWFEKNLIPQLLEHVGTDLMNEVKQHLGIDQATQMVSSATRVRPTGESFPILDALSFHMKLNLRNILTPPVQKCLLCEKPLQKNNKPVNVPLHKTSGAELASKYM